MQPRMPIRVAVRTRVARMVIVEIRGDVRMVPMNGTEAIPPSGRRTSKKWFRCAARVADERRYVYCARIVATK